MKRREFVLTTAAAGLAAASPRTIFGQAPAVITQSGIKPLVIASANGHQFKNGGKQTCVEKAFSMITQGADVLDAVIAGVNIVELDPEEASVGYGGYPNADGVVQLDSCCMHGPLKRAGGVAALEGVRTPSLVAKAVMDNTDHHLLVGKGAQDFARNMGFKIEDDLNTEKSRKAWLDWKRRIDPEHYLDPKKRVEAGYQAALQMGAGLYVDGDIGAAGSTGRGEANLYNLTSFLIVEGLRQGMHPKDAGMAGLKRIKANTIEKRLRKPNGDPNFGINFYILNAKGEHAGVTMFASTRSRYAICTENGPQLLPLEGLLPG
jgi:N4-(beta-N-acetylglucosaminyl)-L-asparaginase